MKRCLITILIFNMFLSMTITQEKKEQKEFTKEQKTAMVKLLVQKKRFIDMPDIKEHPETCNNFFTMPIYKKLMGNIILGFMYDGGFTFKGKDICIKRIKFTPDTSVIKNDYRNIFKAVFRKNGFKTDNEKSNYELQLCVVQFSNELTEISYPNVIIEFVLHNKKTKKTFFRRCYCGKKEGLKIAMIDSAIQVIVSLNMFRK